MNLSLDECVAYLIVLLQKDNVRLPLQNYKPWHLLFYKLKKSEEILVKPDFFDDLSFDWDKSYPESPELSAFLHFLGIAGIIVSDSPKYENYRITEVTIILLEQKIEELDEETRQFLNTATDIAKQEFTSM